MANGERKLDPAKSAKNFGKAAKAAAPLAKPPNEPFQAERKAGLLGIDALLGKSLRGSKQFTKKEVARGYRKL